METGAGLFLALALLDPERFVADHDVDRWAATGRIDTAYLLTLSSDAAPALARLPETVVTRCEPARMVSAEGPDWRSLHASRAAAAPLGAGPRCGLS